MKIFLILFFTSGLLYSQENSFFDDIKARSDFLNECLNNKKFGNYTYKIKCETNYHHYNSSSSQLYYDKKVAIDKGSVRISEFNALHPGMGKTRFKDYKKVAQILNEFDIIGVTELIPLMGEDYAHNNELIQFIDETPAVIESVKSEIKSLKVSIAASTRGTLTKERTLKLLEKKLLQLKEDLNDAKSLYRKPGYLKILDALQGLRNGEQWSLILAPQGEGAETSNTTELVGYYYKSSIIRPNVNHYCAKNKKWGKAIAYACIINMDALDMGEDKRNIISRRPFLGSFKSGNFSFSLLTGHILFNSPDDETSIQNIMQESFGVKSYQLLGTGINKENYARFAEVKLTLEFIEKNLKTSFENSDIIYMGDFNLEKDNQFWDQVLPSWPGSKIFINDMTSLSTARFDSDNTPTYAGASNYDHFIFDPTETTECTRDVNPKDSGHILGGVYNFTQERWGRYLDRIYKVRQERYASQNLTAEDDDIPVLNPDYLINKEKYQKVVNRFIKPKLDRLAPTLTIARKNISFGKYQMSTRGIVVDEKLDLEYAVYFKERVLNSQFNNDTYYYYFEQLISDHFPIYMKCSTR